MLNILSFRDVGRRFKVTADTSIENDMCVHTGDGTVLEFKEVELSLYLLSNNKFQTRKKVSAYSNLTLVRANKNNFTNANIARDFRKS